MKKLGIFYLLIATLSYGALQVIDKLALNSKVDASSYTISRVFIAAVFLAFFILFRNKQSFLHTFKKENLKDLIIIGILASGISLLFQIIGLSFTTATNASIILTFVAPLTSFFAFFILKETLPKRFFLALLFMLAGSILIIYKPVSPFGFGDFLIFIAVLCFAYSNVYAKRTMKNIPTRIVTFGRLLFGSLSLAILIPFFNFNFGSLVNSPYLIMLGGLIFGIRMVAYYKGIEIEGASIAATFLLFSPVVTVFLAVILLGEPLTFNTIGGLVFVIIGGLLLTRIKSII